MAKSKRELLITLGADTTKFSQKVKRAKDLTKELDSNFKLLSSSTKNFEKSIDGLTQKQKYLEDRMTVTNSLSKVYNDRLKEQQDLMDKARSSVERLTKETSEEVKELKEVQAMCEKGSQEWKDWQKEIDNVTQELQQNEKEFKTYQDRVIALNTAINKNETEMQKMTAQMEETRIKLQMLERDTTFEKMSADISETERKFDNVTNSVDGFGNSVTDLKAKQVYFNTQMEKSTKLMNEYEKDIESSTREMKQMEDEVERLTREVRTLETTLDGMSATDEHFDEYSRDLAKLRTELTSANRIMELHKNRVTELKGKYDSAESSVNRMEGQLKQTNNQLKAFGKQNNFKVLEKALESVRHEFELLDSRLDVLRSSYISFENSMTGAIRESRLLKQQTSSLKQEFKLQQATINEYKTKLKNLSTEYDSLGRKIKTSKESLKHMTEGSDEFMKTSALIGEMEREFEELDNEIKEVTNSLRQMQISSNNTLTSINNNIVAQGRGWDVLSNKIKTVGNGIVTAGNALRSAGGALTPLTMGVTALGGAVIKTGMEFQEGMDKAKAVMGATQEETQELINKGRELASQSRWTATDVADAYGYMGMAGWTAKQSLDGIAGVLDLATAGATDLATTSDIVTDGLTAMGLKAKDTAMFTDVMSATMVGSNTNIQLMGETLKYAGSVAGGLGITMQDLSLAIGTMANSGIKGSMSGTALRSGLTRLIAPTKDATALMQKYGIEVKKTSDGNVDLRATMKNLQKSLSGLDKDTQSMVAKTIFGQTAMNGWLAIINNGGKEFDKLASEIDKASKSNGEFTKRLAYDMNNNLIGDIRTFKSTLEESFLTIYEDIGDDLRKIVQKATEVVKALTEKFKGLDESTKSNIVKFTVLLGVLAPVLSVLGFLTSGVGHSVKAFGSLVGVTGKLVTKFGLVKQNGTLLTKTVGSLANVLTGNLLSATVATEGAMATGLGGALAGLSAIAIPALLIALAGIVTALGENENALTWLQDKWGGFGVFVGQVLERISGLVQLLVSTIGGMIGTFGSVIKKVVTGQWTEIDDAWKEGTAKMQVNARKAISDLNGESTKAIKYLRTISSSELGEIRTIFEDTFKLLPTVTSDNISKVADNLTKQFKATNRDVIDLSETTLDTLRGTSETMAVLFNGIGSEMDISDAKKLFEDNLSGLLYSGKITTEELEKDFKKATDLIDKNLTDGMQRATENAENILSQFNQITKGQLNEGVDDIVSILGKLDEEGIEKIKSLGTNWESIFKGINISTDLTTKEMKDLILKNIEELGLDTPEKLQAFKDTLKYELDTTKTESTEKGKEIGEGINEGISEGVNNNSTTTAEEVKNTTKEITENATNGAKEGFDELPDAVREKLEQAGVTINEQGNVIVEDMAKKGKEGAKAYIDEMNSELPSLSEVAGTIELQLEGINSVKFGGVTKQLSEINKWLNTAKKSAILTGASLAEIKTITYGSVTKGLSEINKWLIDYIKPSAEKVKKAFENMKSVTYGSVTKGLSEINKWLRDNLKPNATNVKNILTSISNIRFGGVTSSLSLMVAQLNSVKSSADNVKTAINQANLAKPKIMEMSDYTDVPKGISNVIDTRDVSTFSINDYKTSGGYYSPNSMSVKSKATSNEESNLKALYSSIMEQNQILLTLLGQQQPVEVNLELDGKSIAKASASYMNNEINKITKRKNRLGGVLA